MEDQIQQNNPPIQPITQATPPAPSPSKRSKILLFTVLGLVIVAGLVFVGIQISKNKTPSQTDQITVIGVIRSSGLNEDEKQNLNLPNVNYQLTDFNNNQEKDLDGYFLISNDNALDALLGKCVQITGTEPAEWKNKNKDDSSLRTALVPDTINPIDNSRCTPYLTTPFEIVDGTEKLILRGVVDHSSRPAPDIGYDYQIKLSKPLLDIENGSGLTQISTVDAIPSTNSVWIELENNINKEVEVQGFMEWGYSESRYFSIISIKPVSTSESNNWRTYIGKTFSFQYPNSWADAIEDISSTRTEVVSEGNLVVSDGTYYSQDLGRAQTYQEYIDQVIPKSINTSPFNLGNLNGVRYIDEDNAGRSVVNIILSDKPTSTRIFSIIYLSPVADVETINSIIDPVLSTFTFAQ